MLVNPAKEAVKSKPFKKSAFVVCPQRINLDDLRDLRPGKIIWRQHPKVKIFPAEFSLPTPLAPIARRIRKNV